MTIYEQKMKEAKDNDKVVFYDYLMYKRAAGWWTGFINDDWHRPLKSKLQKARYNAEFLQNLPNYYFLGIPIKEFLKSNKSGGRCHSCAVALSLCFDDFKIITCNLLNYVDHLNFTFKEKRKKFEHSFLSVNIGGIETIIDTTWGMITDFDTYKDIFNIDDAKIITSKEIKNTEVYKYIESKKNIIGPPYNSEIEDSEYKKYWEELIKYMDMCQEYRNEHNIHLQNFISKNLHNTSNSFTFSDLRSSLQFKIGNDRFLYPIRNMFSLEDDEFDNTLYSSLEETNTINEKVLSKYQICEEEVNIQLEDYNKQEEDSNSKNKIKQKVLKFIEKIRI